LRVFALIDKEDQDVDEDEQQSRNRRIFPIGPVFDGDNNHERGAMLYKRYILLPIGHFSKTCVDARYWHAR
jgi:hypothetical protein